MPILSPLVRLHREDLEEFGAADAAVGRLFSRKGQERGVTQRADSRAWPMARGRCPSPPSSEGQRSAGLLRAVGLG